MALLAVFSTHPGQLLIFRSLYLNIPFFIRRVLGGLATLAETTSFIGRQGARAPGLQDAKTFRKTIAPLRFSGCLIIHCGCLLR
ncbi:hypothetical protein RCIA89 [Methanocella arvoryzae MRE50]|uniref:Uncharacterized protein n=1 Tax=Methanocella arvoryzae (strain DSM 22066 / NBRC 105507 / MRE50) TaxID=351160 RepID=Q0W4Z7_METAR|nr:hypothetical protein RCIA89 [Methanocella arvoryzae MRE50]